MNPQHNTVILARVSSKAQEDEGYSLDSQLKLLETYCEKNGLHVVRVFKVAETASKEQSRKIFHAMLEYLHTSDVYHLAVEKTDRFTRNFKDAVAIDDWLDQNEHRRVHAVKENILLHKYAKSDVKFMWNIHLSVAKKYTDNLREEAMKGWAEKLAQGWLPAPPPPGYMTITDHGKRIHVPDPNTKQHMQELFQLYLEPDQTILSIAHEMNARGLRTRPGRPYVKSHVQKILCNPFYIGINRFNGKDYQGAQTPLISTELFERVQIKLHGKRPLVYVRHNPTYKSLIRCADCGSTVTWQLQKGRYYGLCKRLSAACKAGKALREDRVEAMVSQMLKDLVCPAPEIIDWVIATMRQKYKRKIENHDNVAAFIQSQIDRIDRMDSNLYDDKLAGEISSSKYKEKHEQFIADKNELLKRLKTVERPMIQRLEQRVVILRLTQKAAEIFPKKAPEQKRLILSKLFEDMTISGGSLSVSYTEFAQIVAEKVLKTRNVMEASK